MSFTAPKFTGVGRQLQTRVIAGDTLTFTTIKLGDGTMTTEPIAALTDLIHGIITLPVHEVRRNADYADVTGVFQNAGLSSGFYWREIGIFAADPDYPNDRSHDILYCYQNAAELAEYIPSASSAVIEKIIRVACVVGDAESVTVGLTSQAYAKAEDLQALEEQHSKDVERINDALDAVDPTKVTAKAEPADGDGVMIADSTDSGKAKRLLWSNVKAALGKLFVPLARKVNGKTLTEDVTLTAADIKMPDSEEDVGVAMAKRLAAEGNVRRFGSIATTWDNEMYASIIGIKSGGFFEVYNDYACRTQLTIAPPTKGTFVTARLGQTFDGEQWEVAEIATRISPERHELPLAEGWERFDAACQYYKTQENLIVINIAVRATKSFVNSAAIATLPEGFRPTSYTESPAMFKGSQRMVTILANTDGTLVAEMSDHYDVAVNPPDYFFATLVLTG